MSGHEANSILSAALPLIGCSLWMVAVSGNGGARGIFLIFIRDSNQSRGGPKGEDPVAPTPTEVEEEDEGTKLHLGESRAVLKSRGLFHFFAQTDRACSRTQLGIKKDGD